LLGKWSVRRNTSRKTTAEVIRVTISGTHPLKRRKGICLFASYESSGQVAPYVINYLQALNDADFDIIFIQSSDTLTSESNYDGIRPLCRTIINRTNAGYDFFSWKVGLSVCADLSDYEMLLFTNDSIIGPFSSLTPLVTRMRSDADALWGLTDCYEAGAHHLQSYFLFCQRAVFTSSFFKRFWNSVTILTYKWQFVLEYEVGFSQAAQRAGVPLRAAFPYEQVRKLCLEQGSAFQFCEQIKDEPLNPTLYAWDILIREMQFPFIKSELLRDNRLDLENLDDWSLLVAQAPRPLVDGAMQYEESWRWAIPERKEPALPMGKAWGFLQRRNAALYAHLCHRYDQLQRFLRDVREGNTQEITRKLRKSQRLRRLISRIDRYRKPTTSVSAREVYFAQAQEALNGFLERSNVLELPTSTAPQITVILVLFNKAELTYRCLESLSTLGADPSFHVLIVDNASSDQTQRLLERVRGATIVRNEDNRGFLRACNQAAGMVTTRHILFLNNDTILYPGALQAALENLEDPRVGAVGGRIVLPSDELQEAGSIFWNDGTCVGYARSLPPEADECMFRRSVDYCSGVFLMTSTKLFRDVGCFDERYIPAYYEEADYCAQLQSRGLQIIYDPRILVRHVEFGSSQQSEAAFALMTTNRGKFIEKNRALLDRKLPPQTPQYQARTVKSGNKKKILFIDDRAALTHLGAGYPRMNRIIKLIAGLERFDITIACTESFSSDWTAIRADIPIDIEVLDLTAGQRREQFLRERLSQFDVVWVSRPSNMRHLLKVLPTQQRNQPRTFVLVYDSEAIFADRSLTEAHVFGFSRERAEAELEAELSNASHADLVVAVCESDARRWRERLNKDVLIIGLDAPIAPGPRNFRDRKDILFTGSLHDVRSPNADALFWFMGKVMPIVQKTLPDVRVNAVGFVEKTLQQRIGRRCSNFTLVGRVPDLQPYLLQHRIMVAPTRFAAGIPQKVFDAAVRGTPTVCSPLIASQMQWHDGVETLVGSIEDPQHFAAQCIKLYTDQTLWEGTYDASLSAMRRYSDEFNLERGVQEVVAAIELLAMSRATKNTHTSSRRELPLTQSAA
jgi:GT2 family glycosyltransferase